MSRTLRRGYNAALLALRRRIGATLAAGELSEDERRTLAFVDAMSRGMRLPTRQKPRLATFAARYGVCLRTVKNWKRAGCPFAKGHRAVLAWMFRRFRILPAGPKQKFAREFHEMAFAALAKAARDTGRGVYPDSDLPTRASLARRINVAMRAADRLEGGQILKAARVTYGLTKAAVRAGLWE